MPNVPGESSPDSGKDLPDATTTSIEKLPKRFEYVEPPKNGKLHISWNFWTYSCTEMSYI